MQERYDVCVIGGGAAGMSAAIAAAEGGCSVCIVDKNKKLGRKLYATGNGRCNLANTDMDKCHYHSYEEEHERTQFLNQSIGEYPNTGLFEFLDSMGVYTQANQGYYYPVSMQASAVVWAFLDRLKALGVTAKTGKTVTEITKAEGGYLVSCEEPFYAKNIILATGGCSYASLGGSTSGYALAQSLGLSVTKQSPALCGMYTSEDTEAIKGVRAACSAWIETDKGIHRQSGELQLTEYGLSGIMIFNLASMVGRALETQKEVTVYIDFLEHVTRERFLQGRCLKRNIYGYLNAFMPDKLARYILESAGVSCKKPLSDVTTDMMEKIYDRCRCYPFHVKALRDYENAQVTAGGVMLADVDAQTMEVKGQRGMYVAGELLDMDGDCGGYNLTFAILTGRKAGENCHA